VNGPVPPVAAVFPEHPPCLRAQSLRARTEDKASATEKPRRSRWLDSERIFTSGHALDKTGSELPTRRLGLAGAQSWTGREIPAATRYTQK
jgi:hypothetical protein